MKQDLRILIAYSTRYPQVRGGVDTMIVTLVDQLKQRHHVTLFAAGTPEETDLSCTTEGGVKTYVMHLRLPYYGSFRLRNFCAWLLEFPRSVMRLRHLLRDEAVDVVHLHMLNRYHLAFLAVRLLGGPPYVVTLHGSDVRLSDVRPPVTRAIERLLLSRAAAVSAVSESMAVQAYQKFPFLKKIVPIANGISAEGGPLLSRSEIEVALKTTLPQRYFTSIGALLPVKAHEVTIDAWVRVLEEHPDLHLFIIGAGPLEDAHRRHIASLGLNDRVHMTGALPRNLALSIARHGMGFVMPSRFEGLAYALLEAGLIGLPVVCSDIPSFLDVVTGGETAMVVPVDDSAALADAVKALAQSEPLRQKIGSAFRETIETRYSGQQMASQYEQLYQSAIQPSRLNDRLDEPREAT